jgi:CRP/FNR family transcriptional regulator, cyclic AMP receptor protein
MISPELLRRYPCFATISEASLKAVAMMAKEECVPAGTEFFHERDPADTLRVIVEGEVRIEFTMGNGELRTVDTLIPGDLVGWSALVEPYKMTAVATASVGTRLIAIEAARLRELCNRDPMLGYRLLGRVAKLLADRLEGARLELAAAG